MGPTGWLARLASVPLLGLAGLLAPPASAHNQGLVERDGTLKNDGGGPVGAGFDPLGRWANYLITPELGEQHGGNLFHSFRFSASARARRRPSPAPTRSRARRACST